MKVSMAVRLGLTIAALLTAGVVSAQAPGGGPGFGEHRPPMERALGPHGDHGRWWNEPAMIEKLKLTDDQRKGMDAILLQHRETLIDLRGSVDKAELGMEPLMRDDQPNEAKILAQIDKVAQARAELEKANARFLLAIRAKLTPDQWKTLETDRMQHRGWGQGAQQRPGGTGRRTGRQSPGSQQPPTPPVPGPQGRLEEGPGPDGPGLPGMGINQ